MDYDYYGEQFVHTRVRRKGIGIRKMPVTYRTSDFGSRGRKKQEFIQNLYYNWAKDIIRIRGEYLAENSVKLTLDFLDGKTLTQLAKKYVRDDYKISPRTGRRIIYHALELLVSKRIFERKYLNGINPDPLNAKKPYYGKQRKNSRVKKVKKFERELVAV